jgi:hypothetical protein
MKIIARPKAIVKITMFEKLLNMLCLIKVIPLVRNKKKGQMQFKILSFPTLLSTLWCWIPLAYYIFVNINWPPIEEDDPGNSSEISANSSQEITDSSDIDIGYYIFQAFVVLAFLMILLLPAALGNFFACTQSKPQKRFAWSPKGWVLGLATAIYLITEITSTTLFSISYQRRGMSLWGIVHNFASYLLMNGIPCLLQFSALLLVSSRQASFMKNAAQNKKVTTYTQINDWLEEYELIKCGTAPLYALEFCIHTPIMICFSYLSIYTPQLDLCLWSSGKITWSSLTLIHICLMSEDCYAALQNLVPAIG